MANDCTAAFLRTRFTGPETSAAVVFPASRNKRSELSEYTSCLLRCRLCFALVKSLPAQSASLKAVAFAVAWCNTFLNGSCVYSGVLESACPSPRFRSSIHQATTASHSAQKFLLPTRPHLGLSAVSTAAAAMLPLSVSFSIGAVVVEGVRKGWPALSS